MKAVMLSPNNVCASEINSNCVASSSFCNNIDSCIVPKLILSNSHCYTLNHILVCTLLLYFYFTFMWPLIMLTRLISAVATISILSSYNLIWLTLSNLPVLSHSLTHVQPLPPDFPWFSSHRCVYMWVSSCLFDSFSFAINASSPKYLLIYF